MIDAPAEKVWAVLTDFDRHPRWNPFIKAISGDKRSGGKLRVHIVPPDSKGMVFKPQIVKYKENIELRWKGKLLVPGLFDGEHYFILSKSENNKTEFVHGELFSGILTGLFSKSLEKTKEGFELMNQALKAECEKA
jgi:hypothetical protein